MRTWFTLIITLMLSACTVIGPTERGVRYNMGSVDDAPLNSGTHLWVPYFSGSQTLDVSIKTLEIVASSGTKDQQEITTTAVLNIQADPTKVVQIVREYGSEDAMLKQVTPQFHEAINANISKLSAEEVLTKRKDLKDAIEVSAKAIAVKYGAVVHDVSIKDLQYSKEYADAIERKQIAEQKAKQAEYDAQRAIKDADAAVNKARGQAESQRMVRQSLTKEILQQQAIEKWDGKFPQVMGGNGTLPFLNLKMDK